MRSLKFLALGVAGAVALSLGAFAKDVHSANFDLVQRAKVGSTILQPGHYKAEWNGPDNALQISIVQHGKTVATAHGTMKELGAKSPYSAVVIRTDNSQRLDEIDFANRTEALVLGGL